MPMNMKYCQFTNTLAALRECLDTLTDEGLPENEHERKSAIELVQLCRDIGDDFGDVVDDDDDFEPMTAWDAGMAKCLADHD